MKKIKAKLDKKDGKGFKREGKTLHFPGANIVIQCLWENDKHHGNKTNNDFYLKGYSM